MRYTEYEFREAVRSSKTIKESLEKLGVIPAGGNYAVFNRKVLEWGIDTTHFSRSTDIARSYQKPKHASFYFKKDFYTGSHSFKLRLLRDGYFIPECSICRLGKWQNKEIPLELDHIDGDNSNNLFENLRLVCPNCHAQTDTYRGKNVKKRMESGEGHHSYSRVNGELDSKRVKYPKNSPRFKRCDYCYNRVKWFMEICSDCRRKEYIFQGECRRCYGPCTTEAEVCLKCHNKEKSSNIPTPEDLLETITRLNWNFSATGRFYGVSDNAVRKWCKKYDIVKPLT